LGCSEPGVSAAIVASRNPDVRFLVSITSLFLNGPDFYINNIRSRQNYAAGYKLTRVSGGFQTMLKDSFRFDNKIYKNTDKAYDQCFFATMDSLNKIFYKMKDDQTDIYKKVRNICRSEFLRRWNVNDFNTRTERNFKYDVTLYIDSVLSRDLYARSDFELVRWNPLPVFEKIKIPVLAVLGDKDGLILPVQNAKRAQDVFDRYNKKNTTLLVLKDYGHALWFGNYLSNQRKTGTRKIYESYDYPIDIIVNWILKN